MSTPSRRRHSAARFHVLARQGFKVLLVDRALNENLGRITAAAKGVEFQM